MPLPIKCERHAIEQISIRWVTIKKREARYVFWRTFNACRFRYGSHVSWQFHISNVLMNFSEEASISTERRLKIDLCQP
ncbi:protein of unknown function [Paraburkholderia kururiensis]